MSDIDVGQLSEAINDKMDRDMGNQNTGIHHIIETYVDGTSGYRIWDDGYCEQWGVVLTSSAVATVTLLKTYASNDYNLLTSSNYNVLADGYNSYGHATSTSQINVYSKSYGATPSIYVFWKTLGYLASGQY